MCVCTVLAILVRLVFPVKGLARKETVVPYRRGSVTRKLILVSNKLVRVKFPP